MSNLGKRLIKAAREGRAIARGELDTALYRVHVAADFAEFGRRGRRRHRRAEARAKAEAGAKLDEVRRALLVKIRKFVNDEREWLDAPRVGRELI